MTDPAKMTDDELVNAIFDKPQYRHGKYLAEVRNRLRTLRIAAAVKCSCCQPVDPQSISYLGMQP